MKKQLAVATLALTALFGACKKSDSNDSNATKIIGKWNTVNSISKVTVGGITGAPDTTVGVAGEYLEFKNDGKVYSHTSDGNGSFGDDTSTYKINNNQLLVWDSGNDTTTMNITTLNSSTLSLYGQQTETYNGSTFTVDMWMNLKK